MVNCLDDGSFSEEYMKIINEHQKKTKTKTNFYYCYYCMQKVSALAINNVSGKKCCPDCLSPFSGGIINEL